MWKFEFDYDKRGYGRLKLFKDDKLDLAYEARTGSVKDLGNGEFGLVNNIPVGLWTINEAPVDTNEVGMYIKKGQGWKVRLFQDGTQWTHYLIHPDGNKPGTKGCIGLQGGDYRDLKDRIVEMRKLQEKIPVIVSSVLYKPKPEEIAMPKKMEYGKTLKKYTPTVLAGTFLSSLICKTAPAIPQAMNDSGVFLESGEEVIAVASIALLAFLRDMLKHKFGIRIPFLL